MKKEYHFTAQIERDPESGLFIGMIPELPGAHTQAGSLDELHKNLQEVTELCLDELTDEEKRAIPEVIGHQMIKVTA